MDGRIENPVLRSQLDRITGELTGDQVGRQRDEIQALRAEHPHSIELETRAVPGDPASFRYTCFQYALGLVDPPRAVVHIARLWPEVYPNARFVRYLIDHHLIAVAPVDGRDGDIVLYFAGGVPTHAGVVRGQQVVSKWGTAHLWRHGLFEVPAVYGSEVRMFRWRSVGEVEEAFLDFAEAETGQRFIAT